MPARARVIVVVDSSVWIALLRNQDTPEVHRLRAIDPPDRILVGDLILLEILQGARDETHAARIERNLRRFPIVPMLGEALAIRAATHACTLRGRRVSLRKTIDLIIGTFCIEYDYALLHADRDFLPMTAHLGLRTA